jgi:tRNA threonylcarbamoyl adenosine modification protein YeaZ
VILVVDTSATTSAWAALLGDHDRTHVFTTFRNNRAITTHLAEMVKGKKLTAVAVATGPGSFTGLRVGVSFGLGLAMGLRVPIIPLPSLELRAARSHVPATAVLDAGRGRVYYQVPGGKPALGEPAGIPATHPLVGNVAPQTEAALIAAGHHFVPEGEMKDFSEAAKGMLEGAREVAYGSLKIEYMQSFSARN